MKYFLDDEEVTLKQLKEEKSKWEFYEYNGSYRRITLDYIDKDCMYFHREIFENYDY